MVTRVNLAEAKAKFSAVVDDVDRKERRYVIVRHGRPVAAIVSMEDLARLEESTTQLPSPAGALALVGLWADVDEEAIDKFLGEVHESRERDPGRPVHLQP
ncbi:MAG: type II toxin-antitoxin system Phd/YefM family antitoxin [Dehalococcoidia bacterium]|nr:type II toxin-antitoxin system Phd/YefM family antitoxin [Dehalococcoidia bacterium]